MEKFGKNEEKDVYVEPVIEDYGSLEELTAAGGSSFHDVPHGGNSPQGHLHGSTP